MASYTPGSNHNDVLADLYFDIESKTAEGKDKYRKCDALCKDNSGHGNLASHVKVRQLSCWQEELKQHLEGATRGAFGYMDSFVTITHS